MEIQSAGAARPPVPPPTVSKPPSTEVVAGPSDVVSSLGSALARVMPVSASLAAGAAAAATPPPASSAVRVLTDLHDKGYVLSRRRAFWIPIVMKRDVPVTPTEAAALLEKGSTRLRVSSDKLTSVEVQTQRDLDALNAFYLNGPFAGLPQAALADSLNVLYQHGWHVTNKKEADIGPYGAWRALEAGRPGGLVLGKGYYDRVALDSAQTAHRVRFFQGDGKGAALEHAVEAQTLLDVAARGGSPHLTEAWQSATPEDAYQALFVQQSAKSVWLGTSYIAALEVSAADLADPVKTLPAFDAVMKDVAKVEQAYPKYSGQPVWSALRVPIGAEDIDQRLQWLASIKAAAPNSSDEAEGFAAVRKAHRPGERFDDALKEYVDILALTPQYYTRNAIDAFQRLRDHFDTLAPSAEPPAERRREFLDLYGVTRNVDSAAQLWTALAGPGTRAEQVAACKRLLTAEQSYVDKTVKAMQSVVAHLRPGETVTEGTEAYLRSRQLVSQYDSTQGIAAFEFIRGRLDKSMPGPYGADEREQMYLKLMKGLGGHTEAFKALCAITGETEQQPAAADPELPQKIEALLALREAEKGYNEEAKNDLALITQHRRAGEPLADAVADYCDLRGRVSPYDWTEGRKVFAFLRGDFAAAMAGPSSPSDKRAMYIALVDKLKSHDQAVQIYAAIAVASGGAEMPPRVKAWCDLAAFENGYTEYASKALAAVDATRRPGEPLDDVVAEYTRLRGLIGKYSVDEGCAMLRFHRNEIGAALPGPWTDDQRREMYEKLGGVLHSHPATIAALDRLCQRTKDNPSAPPPPDLPQRVDALAALLPVEPYSPEGAWAALAAASSASGTLPDNTADYIALRGRTQSADQGLALFQALHGGLPGGERDAFLKVHSVFRDVKAARAYWEQMKASPAELAERVDALAALAVGERQQGQQVAGALDAVLKARRAGEPLAQACADFGTVRKKCNEWDLDGAIKAFAFMRENVAASREPVFRTLLDGFGSNVVSVWTTLEKVGSPAAFDARLELLVSEPRERWSSLVAAFEAVKPHLPQGVDPDRALLALAPVAATGYQGTTLAVEVVKRAVASAEPDRAATLAWMARLMAGAQTVERFDKAIDLIATPGGAGTVEQRRETFGRLLQITGSAPRGWEVASDILHVLEKTAPDEFASASSLAVELVGAMRDDVGTARDALTRLIEARASGLYGDVPLDVLVTRFGELFTAGGDVDRILSRLEQEARSGQLRIENTEEFVVIGGIKVPKNR